MIRLKRLTGAGAVLLALATGVVPVWAQDRPSGSSHVHPAPIRGLVVGVSSGSLRVQTVSGSVNVTLTSSTKVARMVTGSTADLKIGQFVDAQFVTGTTTIRSIRIDAARGHEPPANWRTSPRSRWVPDDGQPGGRWGYFAWEGMIPFRQNGTSRTLTRVDGQIVSLSSTSITVRGRSEQSATYPLARSVSVTKIVVGRIGDLAMGETVQVCPDHGTAAAFVTILSS